MSMHTLPLFRYRHCNHDVRLSTMTARQTTTATAPHMHSSFAQFRSLLAGTVLACMLGACATLPPPTNELADARQAVSRATDADADQYASEQIALARDGLSRAQVAMSDGRNDAARALAQASLADADLAIAMSTQAKTAAELALRQGEVRQLRERFQTGGR